jgi:GH15 family glucan-1,4-alpha-glucosidase
MSSADRDVGVPAIADYALLGDTRTAALVSSDGSLDWLCIPEFDGAPVFGRLVGGEAAGRFRMGPATPASVESRRYLPNSATVETVWSTSTGRLTLTEGMVADVTGRLLPATLLVRRLTATGGTVDASITFDPRLGDQRRGPRVEHRGDLLVCSWGATALSLRADPAAALDPGRPTHMTIAPGRPLTVVCAVAYREPLVDVEPNAAWDTLSKDTAAWQEWCAEIDGDLENRDVVVRSLITLRLLTHSPSGAPVASPTTSLPEDIGGVRNWDYRYAWARDASIGIGAFLALGKVDESRHFLAWLLHASRLDRPRLPALLTVYGGPAPAERELAGWPGYAGSVPVHIGNGAGKQHQLDGYGWVLDAAWVLSRAGHPLYSETWRALSGFADYVAKRWREPDAGIWEIRGDGAHYVHSKLMGWLTLDRAIRIAETRRTPSRRLRRWRTERDAIAEQVRRQGFDDRQGTYTRTYGSSDIDAALLILPLLGLEEPNSVRVNGTIGQVRRQLTAGGPLLYRYPPGHDGVAGGEGAFLPCSFWLATALATTGCLAEAEEVFARTLEFGSPLGLFPEQIDPHTGAHLGNFPQALTHAALVQAALAIRAARQSPGPSVTRSPTLAGGQAAGQ